MLGALAVLGVVVAVVVVMVNRGDDPDPVAVPSASRTATARATPTGTATTLPTVTVSPSPTLRPRGKVTIAVLNATGRAGLAGRVQDKLEDAGYNVIRIGNAPRTQRTTIFFKKSAEADAEALLKRYPEMGQTKPAGSAADDDALITIVLGSDYP